MLLKEFQISTQSDCSRPDFVILEEDVPKNVVETTNWQNINEFLSKKVSFVRQIRNRSVYLRTLSVASIRRSVKRICSSLLTSNHEGYEEFLTEEEMRCILKKDTCVPVDGI